MCLHDAPVRRPILAVSDSTKAGNMVLFDREESCMLPKTCPEIAAIRRLVARAKGRLPFTKDRKTYYLPAYVENLSPKGESSTFSAREP